MFVRSLFPSLVSLLRVSTPIRSRAHSISFNPIPFTRPSSASLDSHSLTSPLQTVQSHSLHHTKPRHSSLIRPRFPRVRGLRRRYQETGGMLQLSHTLRVCRRYARGKVRHSLYAAVQFTDSRSTLVAAGRSNQIQEPAGGRKAPGSTRCCLGHWAEPAGASADLSAGPPAEHSV